MTDILKTITSNEQDPERQDRLMDMPEWNETTARALAAKEGLELTEAHFEVLHYLRRYYLEQGMPAHSRKLSDALDETFAHKGGSQYLYRLFPDGPVNQGTRIAGLPAPAGRSDEGFGTVT